MSLSRKKLSSRLMQKAVPTTQLQKSFPLVNTIMTSENIAKLQDFLKKKQKNTEIEVSFGIFVENKFSPGFLSFAEFSRVEKALMNMEPEISNSFSEVRILNLSDTETERVSLREITENESVVYEKKIRNLKNRISDENWGYTISISSEIPEKITSKEFESKFLKSDFRVVRARNRTRYTTGVFPGIYFDLTKIDSDFETKKGSNFIKTKKKKFELEIEIATQNLETIQNAIEFVITRSQNQTELVSEISKSFGKRRLVRLQPEFETEPKMETEKIQMVLTLPQKRQLFSQINSFLSGNDSVSTRMITKYKDQPVNIKYNNILDSSFNPACTIKLDGIRKFLYCDSTGCYFMFGSGDLYKIGPSISPNVFVFDGEYVVSTNYENAYFFVFDILFYESEDLRSLPFTSFFEKGVEIETNRTRHSFLNRIPTIKLFDQFNFQILPKKYVLIPDPKKRIAEIGEIYRQMLIDNELPTDGIIFTNPDVYGKVLIGPNKFIETNATYKWKPEDELTIDFKAVQKTDGNFDLFVLDESREVKFTGTKKNVYDKCIPPGDFDNGDTIEVKWNSEIKNFEFVRVRSDREYPNMKSVAIDVWNDISDPLSLDTLLGKNTKLMRKVRNKEKQNLLDKYLENSYAIVDIGSGRGGDLFKWVKSGINNVFAIEPNPIFRSELLRRRKSVPRSTNVILCPFGAEETSKLEEKITSNLEEFSGINGIVAFDSLTFFPKDETMYTQLFSTINLLPNEGKFVGIVMDSQKVLEYLKTSQSEEDKQLFEITPVSIDPEKVFGNKIHIRIQDPDSMVDYEEYLFDFNFFYKQMKKYSFELVEDQYLGGLPMYSALTKGNQKLSEMYRKFVFIRKTKAKFIGFSQPKIFPKDPNVYLDRYEFRIRNDLKAGKSLFGLRMISSPNSFLECILRSISDVYLELDAIEDPQKRIMSKKNLGVSMRKKVANKLTQNFFNVFYGGLISEIETEKYLKVYSKSNANTIAFLKYKLSLMNSKKTLNADNFLELCCSVFFINIYVIEPSVKHGIRLTKLSKDLLKTSVYEHETSIVLFTLDNSVYSLCAKRRRDEIITVFNYNDPFILELTEIVKVCQWNNVRCNPHCLQTIENGSLYSPHSDIEYRRILNHSGPNADPQMKYRERKRYGESITVLHWGQRKLLMSEIEFLTLKLPSPKQKENLKTLVVYIGAARGRHIVYLSQCFPNTSFLLIDGGSFYPGLYSLPNITIWKKLITEENASEIVDFAKKNNFNDILFISDIRSFDRSYKSKQILNQLSKELKSKKNVSQIMKEILNIKKKVSDNYRKQILTAVNQELSNQVPDISNISLESIGFEKSDFEKKINDLAENQITNVDMPLQRKVYEKIGARAAMMKFRLGWDDNMTEYLAGSIYLPVWGPQSTTESRLITFDSYLDETNQKVYPTSIYNNRVYEEQMMYFNTVTRPAMYLHNVSTEGIDSCFDCKSEVEILRRYCIRYGHTYDAKSLAQRIEDISISLGKRTLADGNVSPEERIRGIQRTQYEQGKPVYV